MKQTLLFLTAALLGSGIVFAEDAKPKAYPLKTCVVSGEELGTMGKPVVITHDGKEVQFCCKSCIKKFNADPAKYMAKLK